MTNDSMPQWRGGSMGEVYNVPGRQASNQRSILYHFLIGLMEADPVLKIIV